MAAVHAEPLAVLYRASGTVRGRSTVALTAKVAGYVKAVHVTAGEQVTAGQLLVELEANDTQAGVGRQRAELAAAQDARAEAASTLEAARAAAELAQVNHDRMSKLLAAGAITRQAFDEADAQARTASAQLAAAQARLRGAGSGIDIARASLAESEATLGYARVTAPFAGRVVERHVDPGALASPGAPLLVIDDGASLRVEAAVEESRASSIHLGDTASIEIPSLPAPVTGKVGEIVPSIDVASRAFLVKLDLPASVGALAPGTYARVGFTDGTRSRLVVPTSAITSFGALDRVLVVEAGVAHLRMVTRGEVQGPWTEVLSGLDPGEVVAEDPTGLQDGARVEVRR